MAIHQLGKRRQVALLVGSHETLIVHATGDSLQVTAACPKPIG